MSPRDWTKNGRSLEFPRAGYFSVWLFQGPPPDLPDFSQPWTLNHQTLGYRGYGTGRTLGELSELAGISKVLGQLDRARVAPHFSLRDDNEVVYVQLGVSGATGDMGMMLVVRDGDQFLKIDYDE